MRCLHLFFLFFVAGNILYFGNRYRQNDFYFESQWSEYTQKGLMELFTAFSRDTEVYLLVYFNL